VFSQPLLDFLGDKLTTIIAADMLRDAVRGHGLPQLGQDLLGPSVRLIFDRILLDIIPIDIHAQTGPLRHVHKTLLVHRLAVLVQVGRRFVEVDKGVRKAALVKLAVVHRTQRVQIAGAATVDLAAHPERLA